MKFYKLIFTSLILLISFQICIAQEKQKPVLVNEFGEVNWSNFRHFFDNFLIEISTIPNSKGYIVIYGAKSKPLSKYYREILLKTHISVRNFDKNRLIFLYGEERESISTQFWKAPVGADKPEFIEGYWNYKLPQTMEPTKIQQTLEVNEVGYNLFSTEFYSNLLKANFDSRGHLVIYDKSTKGFQQVKNQLLKELVSKNKVRRNQLKFFYLKGKEPNIEFWYVPKISK
jgi:hypothetical protein